MVSHVLVPQTVIQGDACQVYALRIQSSAGQVYLLMKRGAEEKSVPTMKTACISAEKAHALVVTYTVIIG